MARKIRIEYAGARYHVINRGNYRSWKIEIACPLKLPLRICAVIN
jgi:hypothetical protein